MKASLIFPALVPASLVVIGVLMAGESTSPPTKIDDPRAALPVRPKHVDHSQFFRAADFSDVRGDTKQIAHRLTEKCLECHPDAAHSVMATSHWHWRGEAAAVPGQAEEVRVGKANLINNFCISVRSNWPRCTSCHVGYGWEDDTFDFEEEKNVDCLVCHESTGQYVKPSGASGYPQEPAAPAEPDPDYKVEHMLQFARSVGLPSRDNCGMCHFAGGGGDAVKHGDLNGFMFNPSEQIDVHMGRHELTCIDCHPAEDHEIKGRSMGVSFDPKNLVRCTDCHSEQPHKQARLNTHTHTVACQTCHIPVIAKGAATKMWWDWSEAGMKLEDAMEKFGLTDPHDYNPIKGLFKYGKEVEPEYAWYNGYADRYLTGDAIEDTDAVLSINRPLGDIKDPNARIFPFKVHRGKQPYDTHYKHLLIPKTYGEDGFWGMTRAQKHEIQERWHIAFKNGAAEHDLKYYGAETNTHTFDWIETEMFWLQTHMVAPASEALQCNDCHAEDDAPGRLDWEALGYGGDPARVGGRLQLNHVDRYEGWTRQRWTR